MNTCIPTTREWNKLKSLQWCKREKGPTFEINSLITIDGKKWVTRWSIAMNNSTIYLYDVSGYADSNPNFIDKISIAIMFHLVVEQWTFIVANKKPTNKINLRNMLTHIQVQSSQSFVLTFAGNNRMQVQSIYWNYIIIIVEVTK